MMNFCRPNLSKLLSLTMLVFTVAVASDSQYCNGRFGFCVTYPSYFGIEPDLDNGDGRIFFDRDGLRMVASGINNVLDESVKSLQASYLDYFDEVTYRRIKNNWFVLSGYKGNNIVYIKSWVGPGSINSLHVEYPRDLKQTYDNILVQVVKSFRPGDLTQINPGIR